MKPFRLTRRALGSAVCMTLLAGTVLFTSPTLFTQQLRVKTRWYSSITVIFAI
mgnify:CR=1 FL=1